MIVTVTTVPHVNGSVIAAVVVALSIARMIFSTGWREKLMTAIFADGKGNVEMHIYVVLQALMTRTALATQITLISHVLLAIILPQSLNSIDVFVLLYLLPLRMNFSLLGLLLFQIFLQVRAAPLLRRDVLFAFVLLFDVQLHIAGVEDFLGTVLTLNGLMHVIAECRFASFLSAKSTNKHLLVAL